MRHGDERYVIEARQPDGTLDLTCAQPETVFGEPAILGISADDMAQVIFRRKPDINLDGRWIAIWPQVLHDRWRARLKTW